MLDQLVLDLARALHVWVLPLATIALVLEAGLLIGVVLLGISIPVGVGILSGTGLVPPAAGLAAVVAGGLIGPSVGFWLTRRAGADVSERIAARLPARVAVLLDRVSTRPALAVAVGQWFAVLRTLAPRLAGRTMSYPRFLAMNGPVAVAWAAATFGLGRLVAAGSAAAAQLIDAQHALATALLVGLCAVAITAVVRTRRQRR